MFALGCQLPFAMRRYLSPELRRRFDIAWFMVPVRMRVRLAQLIRSVRAVDSIAGTVVRLADGTRETLEHEGQAVLLLDTTIEPERAWLLLRTYHETIPAAHSIAVMLHELAHGALFLDDGRRAGIQPEARAEAAAWMLAATWAAHGCLHHSIGYDIACYAMACAVFEVQRWPELTERDVRRAITGQA